MADWTRPFAASYTWWRVPRSSYYDFYSIGLESEQIDNIKGGTITVNNDSQTFESADVDLVGPLDVGIDFVRCKMTATFEDGATETVVLGTYSVAIPSRDVHGSYETCSAKLDGRLKEMSEDSFEYIYTVKKGENGWKKASGIARDCGLTFANGELPGDLLMPSKLRFSMDDSDSNGGSKLTCYNAIMNELGWRAAKTDPYGRIRVQAPIDYDAEPVWSFSEGVNATFLSDATDEFDASDVCNVVIAIYETSESTTIGTAVDDDPNSAYSTVNLGRRKVAKYKYDAEATQAKADKRAAWLLNNQRQVIHRVTIKHVWCGARVGDIVELRYPSAGISGKFAIRTQTIKVGSGGCLCTSELRRFERA